MNNHNHKHSYQVSHLLSLFPASLQKEALSDLQFTQRYGILTDTRFTFPGIDAEFSRSAFFHATRIAFSSNKKESPLKDENGDNWTITITQEEKPFVCVKKQDLDFRTNSFWPLINNIDKRLALFKKEAERRNLFKDDINRWLKILSSEQVADDEMDDLIKDLESYPSYMEERLRFELCADKNKVTTLVPDNILYYERLIGRHASSCNINQYCDSELRQHITNRVNQEICLLDILLCSQRSISQVLAEFISNENHFVSLAKEALKSKNPLCIIGCIEIGALKFLDSCNPILQELFECLCSDAVLKSIDLLCAMTIFIDGELARLRLFEKKPPFYRRLASLTQASLVVKLAIEETVEIKDSEQWAINNRGLFFSCQTLIDLRTDPRWLPTHLTSKQFRNQLYGRIYIVCNEKQDSDFSKHTLQELTKTVPLDLNAFLPGPLEGNTEPHEAPEYISKRLDECMDKQAAPETFIILINSAQFWKIDKKYVEHAVTLLEKAQHQLKKTEDKQSIYQTLNGLARVASLGRNKKLAASVMILSRIYRDYLNVNSEPENILAVGLVASAAYENIDEWAEYIGRWINELVYLPLEAKAIASLKSMLQQLCILEPYLYYTCGRPLEILNYLNED